MSVSLSRRTLRGQNPQVNGFALIVTNDYREMSGTNTLPPLKGTLNDGKKMCETMEKLNFETRWEHNVTANATRKLVREVARCQYLPNYRRLGFIFSGHGTTNHKLYAQDGKHINFYDIMKEFYPDHSPHLGTIPKLFFIDACRGSQITESVLVCKGGHDVTLKVPEQSNFLVAYSTLPGHKAHEKEGEGGIWMTVLSEKLRQMEASVLDVLTAVNSQLSLDFHTAPGPTVYQQPELVSRLNEEVHLLRESKNVVATVPNTTPPSRMNSRTAVDDDKPRVPGAALSMGLKSTKPRKAITARDVSKYSMCSSAKEKIALYCKENGKPEPQYRHWMEGKKYKAKVYVAKTYGWVSGRQLVSTASEAEENVAELLVKKLLLT